MISDQAYMLLALGVALGLGLMAIVQAILQWDGQRRIAGEMREAAAERRAAIAQAVASQPPPRAGGWHPDHRPPASRRRPGPPRRDPGPVAGEGRRARPPAADTSGLPPVTHWDGAGQRLGPPPSASWGEPFPVTGPEPVPSYRRPYVREGQR